MNSILFNLVAAYVFLAALVLLTLVRGNLHRAIKLLLLLVVPLFYFFSYQSWHQAQGWPSDTKLPERFMLHGAVIDEPDAELDNAGQIMLWVSDLKGHKAASQPRAYVVAYDKKLHSGLQEAIRKMQNGKIQIGQIRKVSSSNESAEYKRRFGQRAHSRLRFYDLAGRALPEK